MILIKCEFGIVDMTQRLSYNEYLTLATHIDEIERTTDNLVSQINRMFVKLDALGKTNMKRDEVLARVFDNHYPSPRTDCSVLAQYCIPVMSKVLTLCRQYYSTDNSNYF